jgi:hypothetical protein
MPSGKTLLAGVAALAIAGSGAAVVGAQSPPASLTFDVTAKAATLSQPAVKTGWNKLVFNWKGKGQGGLALVQLKSGVTPEQFAATVAKAKDPSQIADSGKIVASTFWVAGPDKYTTSIKLEDADYSLVDLAKKPVARVSFHAGPEADAVAAEPATDVDVKLGDYAFSMPKTLKSGKQTIRTTNVGKHLHHALVMPLKPGVKDARILADLKKGKEPNYALGGPPSALVEVVSPQTQNDVELNLRKGKYLFVCFLQDSPKDQPHAMKGMRKIVTVK